MFAHYGTSQHLRFSLSIFTFIELYIFGSHRLKTKTKLPPSHTQRSYHCFFWQSWNSGPACSAIQKKRP